MEYRTFLIIPKRKELRKSARGLENCAFGAKKAEKEKKGKGKSRKEKGERRRDCKQGRTKYDFQLSSRKPFGYAAMLAPAVAESFFRPALAVQIEGVWVREDVFVAVGGLIGGDYAFAGFYELNSFGPGGGGGG